MIVSTSDINIDLYLRALSNHNRMAILRLTQNVEVSMRILASMLNITRAAVSQNVALLEELGLVKTRRVNDGTKYVKAQVKDIQIEITPLATYKINDLRE